MSHFIDIQTDTQCSCFYHILGYVSEQSVVAFIILADLFCYAPLHPIALGLLVPPSSPGHFSILIIA